ncbi:MAG: HD domain-containing protein [Treponema sp.]|nr:HD domain-containing protein [Treponema sp.]
MTTVDLCGGRGEPDGGQDPMKDEELFWEIAGEIVFHVKFEESRNYIQHGRISVFEHSIDVARLSFRMGRCFKNMDIRALVRGGLLHDFFLYDWHVPEKMWSLHGWTHPVTAAENAKKYFDVSGREYSCIRSHMWPYTLFHPPKCREGWIICLADKICSLTETLFKRGWLPKLNREST